MIVNFQFLQHLLVDFASTSKVQLLAPAEVAVLLVVVLVVHVLVEKLFAALADVIVALAAVEVREVVVNARPPAVPPAVAIALPATVLAKEEAIANYSPPVLRRRNMKINLHYLFLSLHLVLSTILFNIRSFLFF